MKDLSEQSVEWHKIWDCKKAFPNLKGELRHVRRNLQAFDNIWYRVKPYCKYCGQNVPEGDDMDTAFNWEKTAYKRVQWYDENKNAKR